ncbi:hypothetical protein [Arcanobacterium buesumense]|uniref:Uncharacterized protein n=1 Tax=Arcanobacterium buesumense TaxID=2722751 RepID=A0A6H2EJD6_9ACTO|nr:hypothetical protein [Arcanobacterium buesumense]QJC21254.1 hypothetical protein HC352_01120 [Arcanobacterium buesumense]
MNTSELQPPIDNPDDTSELAHVPSAQLLTAAWEKRAGYARALIGIYGATSLAVGAVFGPYAIALAVAILGAILISGWPNLLYLPNRTIPRTMLTLLAIALLVTALFGTVEHTAIVMAGSVIAAFIAEMFRTDGRKQLIEQLSGGFAGAVVLVAGSLWIHTMRHAQGKDVVIVAAVSLAIVALMHAFDSWAARVAGFINGIAFALGFGYLTELSFEPSLLIGVSTAGAYLLTARAVADLPRPSPAINGASRAMIPLLIVGLFSYLAIHL